MTVPQLLIRASLLGTVAFLALAITRSSAPTTSAAAAVDALPPVSLWWTSDRLEPDTLASAWVIRRHIDASAEFRFVPRGEYLDEGTPFDLPLVPYSRTVARSTTRVLLEAFEVQDPGATRLVQLIDEIELRRWDAEPGAEAVSLEANLRACIDQTQSPDAAIDAATTFLDEFCRTLTHSVQRP